MKDIIEFLDAVGEHEYAHEVAKAHNRLEAFSNGLDKDVMDCSIKAAGELIGINEQLRQRVQELESQNIELQMNLADTEALELGTGEVLERTRHRVQELEKELEVEEKRFSDQWELLSSVTAERDKATQYWQIAEGRCDALKQQRDELLSDVERCYRMLLSEPDTQGALFKAENILREAIASVKEKA